MQYFTHTLVGTVAAAWPAATPKREAQSRNQLLPLAFGGERRKCPSQNSGIFIPVVHPKLAHPCMGP